GPFSFGGEGGMTLGTSMCLALRAAYGCAHRLSCRCVEPTSTWVLNPTTAKQKRPSVRAFFIWRRGWDDSRHLHVPRPSGSLRLCTSAVLPMCRTHFDVGSESHHGQTKKALGEGLFHLAERVGFEPT